MEDTTDDDQFLFDFRNESVVFLEPVFASDDEQRSSLDGKAATSNKCIGRLFQFLSFLCRDASVKCS